MSLRDGVVAVFLGLGVLVTLLSVVGVIVSRNVYQRLHFVTPGAVLAPLLVAAAVVAKETFNVRGLQTIAAVMAMVLLGPILTHATARAARVKEKGDWRLSPTKESDR